MDILERAGTVESREDMVQFISHLIKDYQQNKKEWANMSLEEFLSGMESWIEDCDNMLADLEDVDWNLFATILIAGSRYE
ncbi:hypothetical protein HPY28_16875 [Brevibacillus sp. HB1.2]|jgi:DNA-binding transcriptional regulator YhcF (GntR family)|uniref:DUF7660 domain-containing protein n=2 Tax=Brevibacillus TaxID=55080 RepID=A0ABX5FRX2_9BACL|nr:MULTISPECIES: hypothetical protein [Brevibacillus]MED1798064.1 hypothetical protein [Brevibacillus porteri]MED2132101.1 hypothetical protein [Brevibacillus porteri]MED2742664.1 hypothetical protein [Brevibacillus porteri]MED2814140.1 hypothetical protein [Brevibacillus porteri]MED2893701.1 hypothetical protein [Brevibacillus porteri]